MSAAFNIREVCKQSILLEDHLFQPRRRCALCIRKHMLFYEALLEEASTLNGAAKWKAVIEDLMATIRKAQLMWVSGGNSEADAIGTLLRVARNRHTEAVFTAANS
jgi:hypothetical protein